MTDQIDKLRTLNGELCAEINRQERRIRELEALLDGEIVRCRDCVWAKRDQSDHDYRGEYRCNMWITDVSADGYCWRGMRKEGGDD